MVFNGIGAIFLLALLPVLSPTLSANSFLSAPLLLFLWVAEQILSTAIIIWGDCYRCVKQISNYTFILSLFGKSVKGGRNILLYCQLKQVIIL